jgi:hypothetical protein
MGGVQRPGDPLYSLYSLYSIYSHPLTCHPSHHSIEVAADGMEARKPPAFFAAVDRKVYTRCVQRMFRDFLQRKAQFVRCLSHVQGWQLPARVWLSNKLVCREVAEGGVVLEAASFGDGGVGIGGGGTPTEAGKIFQMWELEQNANLQQANAQNKQGGEDSSDESQDERNSIFIIWHGQINLSMAPIVEDTELKARGVAEMARRRADASFQEHSKEHRAHHKHASSSRSRRVAPSRVGAKAVTIAEESRPGAAGRKRGDNGGKQQKGADEEEHAGRGLKGVRRDIILFPGCAFGFPLFGVNSKHRLLRATAAQNTTLLELPLRVLKNLVGVNIVTGDDASFHRMQLRGLWSHAKIMLGIQLTKAGYGTRRGTNSSFSLPMRLCEELGGATPAKDGASSKFVQEMIKKQKPQKSRGGQRGDAGASTSSKEEMLSPSSAKRKMQAGSKMVRDMVALSRNVKTNAKKESQKAISKALADVKVTLEGEGSAESSGSRKPTGKVDGASDASADSSDGSGSDDSAGPGRKGLMLVPPWMQQKTQLSLLEQKQRKRKLERRQSTSYFDHLQPAKTWKQQEQEEREERRRRTQGVWGLGSRASRITEGTVVFDAPRGGENGVPPQGLTVRGVLDEVEAAQAEAEAARPDHANSLHRAALPGSPHKPPARPDKGRPPSAHASAKRVSTCSSSAAAASSPQHVQLLRRAQQNCHGGTARLVQEMLSVKPSTAAQSPKGGRARGREKGSGDGSSTWNRPHSPLLAQRQHHPSHQPQHARDGSESLSDTASTVAAAASTTAASVCVSTAIATSLLYTRMYGQGKPQQDEWATPTRKHSAKKGSPRPPSTASPSRRGRSPKSPW